MDSEVPEFFAIYGRRRVGKTYLIKKYYENYLVFECSGLNNEAVDGQLENFWHNLGRQFSTTVLPPKSWLEAFQLLRIELDQEKSKKEKLFSWMKSLGLILPVQDFSQR